MKPLPALVSLILLAACQHEPTTQTAQNAPAAAPISKQSCHQRICTREYDPVCATVDSGARLTRQTFGNACSVCSDTGKIVNVEQGACGGVR